MDASDKAVGPSIALKVHDGDSVKLETYARYESKASYGNRSLSLAALATFMGGNYAFTGAFEGATTAQTAQSIQNGLTAAAWGNDDTDQTRPFAYLNYIVFDNNMAYKTAGWQRVSTAAAFNPGQEVIDMNPGVNFEHITFNAPIPITADGYIYVWVSNESETTKVWFDDITVTHTQNLVTQSTDYGVWGDVIREQKTNIDEFYRYGYQGQFAEKDDETGWNHFELREYDAEIGRWLIPDPERQFNSPYLAFNNNPLNQVDRKGSISGPPGVNSIYIFIGASGSKTLVGGVSFVIQTRINLVYDFNSNAFYINAEAYASLGLGEGLQAERGIGFSQNSITNAPGGIDFPLFEEVLSRATKTDAIDLNDLFTKRGVSAVKGVSFSSFKFENPLDPINAGINLSLDVDWSKLMNDFSQAISTYKETGDIKVFNKLVENYGLNYLNGIEGSTFIGVGDIKDLPAFMSVTTEPVKILDKK